MIPPAVERALELAAGMGFARSCRIEDGMLLHLLAARRGVERVGEIGTGCGVATAWLASAVPPGVPVVTSELDARLAEVATALFADDPDVRVLVGDWRAVLPAHAPFDLLFVDARDAKADVDAVVGLVAPRGTIVLDDFTPGWPGPDPRRTAWLEHPDLVAGELVTTPESSVIVAVRTH